MINLKNKKGIILNIGSDLSVISPNQNLYKHLNVIKPVGYSAGKHGLIGITKYFATLWGKKGIRINRKDWQSCYGKRYKWQR